eukprot:TRINITY_DN18204_c0_g1_i1.p1 TRINITY_DN18204_c0_g1~~TRINITY_DN18204_c0_g1_i1.p1  ORF type:complete len:701 (-),score=110.20 TRINITY_DN18204_c0_g1_i1:329-2431(-)
MQEGVPCVAPDDADSGSVPLPLYANLLLAIGLIALSGLFSGLTLGLMSLDLVQLRILTEGGEDYERKYAQQIMPLREKGNLLLCTLLLGNTVVNAFLAILLADITSGTIGLVLSTTLILLLGEITPQSICTRYGLIIGAKTVPVTKLFLFLLYPIAKPISMVLDRVLGKEIGNIYSRDELQALIRYHVREPVAALESGLTHDEHKILVGTLNYKDRMVKDVMTLLDRMFMLEADMKLTFENMLLVYKSGYTRIPVYEGEQHNIVGILFVKDLILVDPDDEIDIKTVLAFHGSKSVKYILDTTSLNDVFRMFKMSYSHIMIAVRLTDQSQMPSGGNINNQTFLTSAKKQVTGIITLEDVLEEVIQAEIVDESDMFVSNDSQKRVKHGRERPDIAAFMTMFDHRIRDSTRLSNQEVQAVCAFLIANVKEFKPFVDYDQVLDSLVTHHGEVIEVEEHIESSDDLDRLLLGSPHMEEMKPRDIDLHIKQNGQSNSRDEHSVTLYHKGEQSNWFSLILQGKVLVYAGAEEFLSELGPWNHLGACALTQSLPYNPDYCAVTYGWCRILRISRIDYEKALKFREVNQVIGQRILRQAMSVKSPESEQSKGQQQNKLQDSQLQQQQQQLMSFCEVQGGSQEVEQEYDQVQELERFVEEGELSDDPAPLTPFGQPQHPSPSSQLQTFSHLQLGSRQKQGKGQDKILDVV